MNPREDPELKKWLDSLTKMREEDPEKYKVYIASSEYDNLYAYHMERWGKIVKRITDKHDLKTKLLRLIKDAQHTGLTQTDIDDAYDEVCVALVMDS